MTCRPWNRQGETPVADAKPAAALQITPELIQAVLAGMTPEQLAAAAVKERQQASLEPLKTQYHETVSKLDELAGQIREIDPTWQPPSPPTVADRILDWVKTQGKAVSKPEIAAGVKTKSIGGALKKMVEKSKTLTFDKTARTHSVPATTSSLTAGAPGGRARAGRRRRR